MRSFSSELKIKCESVIVVPTPIVVPTLIVVSKQMCEMHYTRKNIKRCCTAALLGAKQAEPEQDY